MVMYVGNSRLNVLFLYAQIFYLKKSSRPKYMIRWSNHFGLYCDTVKSTRKQYASEFWHIRCDHDRFDIHNIYLLSKVDSNKHPIKTHNIGCVLLCKYLKSKRFWFDTIFGRSTNIIKRNRSKEPMKFCRHQIKFNFLIVLSM